MKRARGLVIGWTLLVTLLVGSAHAGPSTRGADKLAPDLRSVLHAQAPSQMTRVILRFRDQAHWRQVPTHSREAWLKASSPATPHAATFGRAYTTPTKFLADPGR